MTQAIKDVVMKYFQAWQKQDLTELRAQLSKQFEFESGLQRFEDVDEFTEFCKKLPPWSKVTLIDSVYADDRATLLYEGVSEFGAKFRIAEFLTLDDDKIVKVQAVYSPISQSQ